MATVKLSSFSQLVQAVYRIGYIGVVNFAHRK